MVANTLALKWIGCMQPCSSHSSSNCGAFYQRRDR